MKYIFLFFLGLLQTVFLGQNWNQMDDFPGMARDDGASFFINGRGYCGTGLNVNFSETRDFYAYNTFTDLWTLIAPLPLSEERQYACGFTNDTLGFIFGGIRGTFFFNNLWSYNPQTNLWTPLSPLPAKGRSGAASFVVDNIAYIIGGKTDSVEALKEVWAYDIAKDSWTQKNNLPFSGKWRASGTSIGNKGYLLFGKNAIGEFSDSLFEYNPQIDQWIFKSKFPSKGRTHTPIAPLSGDIVFVGGIDSSGFSYSDYWSYRPQTNQWTKWKSIPEIGRRGGMVFSNYRFFYYTTGTDFNQMRSKQTWRVNHPNLAIAERQKKLSFWITPDKQYIHFKAPLKAPISLVSLTGETIANIPKQCSSFKLPDIPKGVYLLVGKNSGVIERILL